MILIIILSNTVTAVISGLLVWLITSGRLRLWWFKGRYGRTKKKIEDYINLTAESINQEIGYPVLARVMAKRDKSSVKFGHVATVNFRLPRRHGKIISTEGICFIYQRQSGIRG